MAGAPPGRGVRGAVPTALGTPFVGYLLSPTKSDVWQTRLDTMHHERNGCYSSSNNPNRISNRIKSIQIWNTIILTISPTCLNSKKMEALL